MDWDWEETQALDLVCAASLLSESLAQDTHHWLMVFAVMQIIVNDNN